MDRRVKADLIDHHAKVAAFREANADADPAIVDWATVCVIVDAYSAARTEAEIEAQYRYEQERGGAR